MPDVIAQGPQPHQRWRRTLAEGEAVVIGRAPGCWSVPWDPHVSRHHVELLCADDRLAVRQLESASNPVFFRGRPAPTFRLRPGEHFVIGQTSFTLSAGRVSLSLDGPLPLQQHTYSVQSLRQVQFGDPDRRIEVLSRLPEVLSGAAGEAELFVRLVSMLLAGIPRADAAAVIGSRADGPVRVLHWDQRLAAGSDFQPSQSLVLEARRQRQSVLHVWRGAPASEPARFTEIENVDWAFATPMLRPECAEWTLYVSGRFAHASGVPGSSDPYDLREDVKFAELVGASLGSLRHMRRLERQHASLSQFLSPVVLDSIAAEDPEQALTPREATVSVLFCDLRGFARDSERHAGDLMGLLERVSKALGVMTHHIREQGGVVGDFHGDAAMGFWGWPVAHADDVQRTCRAALAVIADFKDSAEQAGTPLAGFQAGIGIATGRAVAGKIGTVDQVKVSVFGPVVNLASRLEGLTKFFKAPILLDEATAAAVRGRVPADVARVRRLAVVRPYGLDTPVEVSELLPPVGQCPELADADLACYEAALDEFLAGRWSKSYELLHRIPAVDRVKDFLTVYIAQHDRTPPAGFQGVIPMGTK